MTGNTNDSRFIERALSSLRLLERASDPQEAQSTDEDLSRLQPPVCLAKEMGQGLGAGAVLFRGMSQEGQIFQRDK